MDQNLSHSKMETYSTCGLKYHFKYNVRLPVITDNINLNYGSSLHKSIELFHLRIKEDGNVRELDYLLECFINSWEQVALFGDVVYDQSDYDSHKELGIKHLTEYYNQNIHTSWFNPPEGVEYNFSVPLINFETGEILSEDYQFNGYIDLIVSDNEYITVVDHKTSSRAYDEFKIKNSLQLVLYNYVTKYLISQKQLPDLPVRTCFNVFYKTKKANVEKYFNEIESIQTKRMLSIAKSIIHGIKSETFVPNFGHIWCNYCEYVNACLLWQELDGKDAWFEEYLKRTDDSNGN